MDICPSRTITSLEGEITTPNYPSNYPRNKDCRLTITPDAPDATVVIKFDDFSLEEDDDGEWFDVLQAQVAEVQNMQLIELTSSYLYWGTAHLVQLVRLVKSQVLKRNILLTFDFKLEQYGWQYDHTFS